MLLETGEERLRYLRKVCSKMATILNIQIIHSHFVVQCKTQKNMLTLNEVRMANLNANKIILKCKPFWRKVYGTGKIKVVVVLYACRLLISFDCQNRLEAEIRNDVSFHLESKK